MGRQMTRAFQIRFSLCPFILQNMSILLATAYSVGQNFKCSALPHMCHQRGQTSTGYLGSYTAVLGREVRTTGLSRRPAANSVQFNKLYFQTVKTFSTSHQKKKKVSKPAMGVGKVLVTDILLKPYVRMRHYVYSWGGGVLRSVKPVPGSRFTIQREAGRGWLWTIQMWS